MADVVEILVSSADAVEIITGTDVAIEPVGGMDLIEVIAQGPAGTPGIATANFIIDGGGSAIIPGVKGAVVIPFNCVISRWSLMADATGSIQLDIWKATYASYPPTVADSISPSNKALISAAAKASSSTLTGWNTTINADDVLVFKVDSATTISRVTLGLSLTRT